MRAPRPFHSPWMHLIFALGILLLVTSPGTRACADSRAPDQRPGAAAQRRGQPPPVPKPPQRPAPGATTVTGQERLEWDQAGPSLAEVSAYHYVAVVGFQRVDMEDVKCAARKPKEPFVCSAMLPPLQPGNQLLRVIAARREGGRDLAGPWSRPLLVFRQ